MNAWSELRALISYLGGLYGFLRTTASEEECRRRVHRQLEGRDEAFLRMLVAGVFAESRSPYGRMCREAGIELGDATALVRTEGLEPTLERLYDAGVYLTLDELRGRSPVRRGRLEFIAQPDDFDNPLARIDYGTRSGGSRSSGMPVGTDLRLLEYHAGYVPMVMDAFGLRGRPMALWFPTAPATTGIRILLTHAKLGLRNERWFSQSRTVPGKASARQAALTWATVLMSKLRGSALPKPEYTPPEDAGRVAEWLAEAKRRTGPALLHTTPGSAVRVCLAADELGIDISDSFFRLGGEPYTPARARVVAAAGCRAASNYYMVELGGYLGLACASAEEFDDVHLLTDKVAVVQRDKHLDHEATVGALSYTTLHPLSPKVLINLASDDYGVLRRRDCGCPIGRSGFGLHLHGIRSHDKLTSEGVTFIGSDLIKLVEEVLPSRFGGSATDFQLVEGDDHGLPSVAIVVSPRIGDIDEDKVVETMISFLRSSGRAQAMMAEMWRTSGTLRVVRRQPYVTAAAKIPALHVLRD